MQPTADDCMPSCPRCRSRKHVYAEGLKSYWCRSCKVCFDDDPSEGGDYSDRFPEARLLREEALAARPRANRRR